MKSMDFDYPTYAIGNPDQGIFYNLAMGNPAPVPSLQAESSSASPTPSPLSAQGFAGWDSRTPGAW